MSELVKIVKLSFLINRLASYKPENPYKNFYKALRTKIWSKNRMKRNLTLKFNQETQEILNVFKAHSRNISKLKFRPSRNLSYLIKA